MKFTVYYWELPMFSQVSIVRPIVCWGGKLPDIQIFHVVKLAL